MEELVWLPNRGNISFICIEICMKKECFDKNKVIFDAMKE